MVGELKIAYHVTSERKFVLGEMKIAYHFRTRVCGRLNENCLPLQNESLWSVK